MNGVNALLGGIEGGQKIRQNQQQTQGRAQIAQELQAGNPQNALIIAHKTGDTKTAAAIQKQMQSMQENETKAALQTSYDVGQIAFAAKRIPEAARAQFAAQQFELKGYTPEKIDFLLSKMTSWDDNTLNAIGASVVDVEKQLANQTTKTQTVNDQVIGTTTDNFTGQSTANTLLTADPSFSDNTKRMEIDERTINNKARLENQKFQNQTARINANKPRAASKSSGKSIGSGKSIKAGDAKKKQKYPDGTKIKNEATGETMVMRGGKWVAG